MLFAVLFEDNETFASERPRHMAAHLAFLERNADSILSAGPLLDPDKGSGAGGLWLVEADDAEAVRALVHTDPFWPTGLRKSIKILPWQQVFRDGSRLIQP